ncbi:MAG TPA: histidine phosphatase family protein [Limnochordia bacterium]
MDLFLVRHGESESNAKISESRDSVLTPLGAQQAERAAEALRAESIERLYCSPQQRALQTAAILCRALGIRPQVWVELSEHGLSGPEVGLPRSVIERRFPDFDLPPSVDEAGWARHWEQESTEELAARMGRVAAEIRNWHAEGVPERAALVIHGGSGTMLLRHLLGISPALDVRFGHTNCGITRLRFEGETVRVLYLNDQRHLVGLPERTEVPNAMGPAKEVTRRPEAV